VAAYLTPLAGDPPGEGRAGVDRSSRGLKTAGVPRLIGHA
jgi:hypothetical protein